MQYFTVKCSGVEVWSGIKCKYFPPLLHCDVTSASALTYCNVCADQELSSKVHVQTTQHENPTASGRPRLRTAERTKKEKLGFLDEKPSFQPKIIHQVPDFSRLHKALQTEALRKTQSKDVTKCQPFYLRTSVLPARQSRLRPENSQVQYFLLLRSFLRLFKCIFYFLSCSYNEFHKSCFSYYKGCLLTLV